MIGCSFASIIIVCVISSLLFLLFVSPFVFLFSFSSSGIRLVCFGTSGSLVHRFKLASILRVLNLYVHFIIYDKLLLVAVSANI